MRIGELSRRTGASVRSLRYYEERGLLHPTRRSSGYRDFSETDVQTVRRVQILLSAGLPTSSIAEILPCVGNPDLVLEGRCPELREGIAKERARMTEAIDSLVQAREILDSLIGLPLSVRPAS